MILLEDNADRNAEDGISKALTEYSWLSFISNSVHFQVLESNDNFVRFMFGKAFFVCWLCRIE